MSRSRNIKPGFFENEILAGMPYEHRLLFIGLWTMADREGRFEDRPTRIKMKLFAADNLDVDAGLKALNDAGFIQRYEADGKLYCQVLAWGKHQSPHFKEQQSIIPAPCKPQASTGFHTEPEPPKAPGKPESSRADSLIPSSLIPDSLTKERATPTAAAEVPPASDPIFGEGLDFLKRKGIREGSARSFLGLLRKELHDDLTVAELLGEAERQDVSNPQSWLSAAAKARKRQAMPRAGPVGPTSKAGQAIELMERMKRGNQEPNSDEAATVVVSRS